MGHHWHHITLSFDGKKNRDNLKTKRSLTFDHIGDHIQDIGRASLRCLCSVSLSDPVSRYIKRSRQAYGNVGGGVDARSFGIPGDSRHSPSFSKERAGPLNSWLELQGS